MESTFKHFEYCVKNYRSMDLYINTTGFAFLGKWPSKHILKLYMPDAHGYIVIAGRRVNFKLLLFKTVYPQTDLQGKFIYKLGDSCNILNLFALTPAQFLAYRRGQINITKNNTGVTVITPKMEELILCQKQK